MTITIEANENRPVVEFIREQAQEKGQEFHEYLGQYIIAAIHEKVQREATAQSKAEERAWLAERAKKRKAQAHKAAKAAA
ncbi:MAG: hypothetical protein Q3986_03430 [Akkermansia sp.]|nr:hypothetical protein [Akkermansia sp.]